jgi:serine protease Do
LPGPGDANVEEIISQWQAVCDRHGVILVVPTPADAKRWERTDVEYLARLSERVISQYKIDPHRIVVYGQEGGGAMAWMLALSNRDVFRGAAISAAPLPRQIRVPQNESSQRLAIYAAIPNGKDVAAQIAAGLQKLSKAGYPVTTVTTSEESGRLSEAQRDELARWIDTLDRF